MEKDVGKIKKNEVTDIVIRVDDFGGRPGVTIREFVNGGSGKYTGFTKSGTRIPLDDFESFKKLINSISKEDFDFSDSVPKMPVPKTGGFTKGKTFGKAKKEVVIDDAGSAEGEEFY